MFRRRSRHNSTYLSVLKPAPESSTLQPHHHSLCQTTHWLNSQPSPPSTPRRDASLHPPEQRRLIDTCILTEYKSNAATLTSQASRDDVTSCDVSVTQPCVRHATLQRCTRNASVELCSPWYDAPPTDEAKEELS